MPRGKRGRRRRKRRVKHPCELGWRIRWSRVFRLYFKGLSIWSEVKSRLKDIERDLISNAEEVLSRLLSKCWYFRWFLVISEYSLVLLGEFVASEAYGFDWDLGVLRAVGL